MLTLHVRRWSLLVLVAGLAVLSTSAWAQQPTAAPAATQPAAGATSLPADTPLAAVGDHTITAGELEAIMAGAPAMPEGRRAQIMQMLLNRMIARDIVSYFVKKNGLKADDAKINEQMDRITEEAKKMNMTPEKLMEQMHINRENIASDVAMTQYVQSLVAPEKIDAFIKAHPSYFDGTQVKVSHILITAGAFAATAEQQEAKKKLEDVAQEIKSGKISFADAAKKYSQDPGSKDKAGEIGWIGFDLESYAPSFVLASFNTPKGQVSDIARTEFGWHLIQVNDVKPGELKIPTSQPGSQPTTEFTDVQNKAKQAILAELNNHLLSLSSGDVQIKYFPAMEGIAAAAKAAENEPMGIPGAAPAPGSSN